MSLTAAEIVEQIQVPEAESRFFDAIGELPTATRARWARWARNYLYFSIHQVRLLPLVLQSFDPRDHQGLAMVSEALFEELGSGDAEKNHSVLFERIATALGVSLKERKAAHHECDSRIGNYVDEIERAYSSGSNPTVLGAYAYLERSAVLSYPLMLERFTEAGFSEHVLEFLAVHVIQEAGHDEAAVELVDKKIVGDEALAEFETEIHRMHTLWGAFWEDFQP